MWPILVIVFCLFSRPGFESVSYIALGAQLPVETYGQSSPITIVTFIFLSPLFDVKLVQE